MSIDAQLLSLQEHDSAIDSLTAKLADLPEATVLEDAKVRYEVLFGQFEERSARRRELDRSCVRLENEASSLASKISRIEKKLASGKVSNPREMQALSAEMEMLRRKQTGLEDNELAYMLEIEELDAELSEMNVKLERSKAELDDMQKAFDAEKENTTRLLHLHREDRKKLVETLDVKLFDLYERIRSSNEFGIGVARLEGNVCQACHLRLAGADLLETKEAEVPTCPHCGVLLLTKKE